MIKEVKDKLFNIIDMSDSLVDFKGKKPEHCILPEHYSELANDLSVFVTSLLDNWISVDSEIKDSIEFFRANGFSENNYIASHVKSVLDSNNEPDDDSEILSREFQDNLENIHKLLFNIISPPPPPQPPNQSTKKRGGCNP